MMTICPVCHRNHDITMPCSKRMANAYMMQPMALEELTQPDKDWMSTHKIPDVVSMLEEEIANRL